MFVDRVEITFQAGRGGDGCTSFRREMFVPHGGPDGGDGGNGASITLQARVGTNSLAAFANRKFFRAEKGQPGQGSMRHGRNGREMRLYVPCGTSVIDAEDGFVIKDLTIPGEEFVIARGGKGGHGNAKFKSSTNQAPREHGTGTDGESRVVILELKSIADVGLVGKPNAGKSTLLSRITSARPEIADYPFTTKHPNLGIVDVDSDRSFVLADIPGLIEGASEGIGLGHEFLRHVERAGLLIHLVEPAPVDGSDPIANYDTIREELKQYDPTMASRDELVVLTKCELDPDGEVQKQLAEHLASLSAEHSRELMVISAASEIGLRELVHTIMDKVATVRQARLEAGESITPLRQEDEIALTKKPRRTPPHKTGLTATMSNDRQAKDVEAIWAVPPQPVTADDDQVSSEKGLD